MAFIPPLALILDLLLADPRRLPHPVGGIARLAALLEAPARAAPDPKLAGVLALAAILLLTGSLAALLIRLPWLLGPACALYLAWAGLALGGLLREGRAALRDVQAAMQQPCTEQPASQTAPNPALERARRSVGMLVSRDTSNMDPPNLCRSLAESISENFNDAFVAPWFWLCLGGPVGLWLYKAASTMDSLWGYKTEAWRQLGWASARLDDVLAYLPARLAFLLLLLTAAAQRLYAGRSAAPHAKPKRLPVLPGLPTLRLAVTQAKSVDSPNAGWPMSAAAWLFNGRCGGPTPYHGLLVDKPRLGPEQGAWTPENTAALLHHVRLSGILGGVIGSALVVLACV
jgi:adenosylcobinamide-phosphate synthase